jgi:tyrosyl-tRNA synthetase
MTKLSEELSWRGFINQMTFSDVEDLNQPRTFYWGVDPSADSMTIGNLAPAMMIRHMMNHGHKAVLLVGGATGMIGDPDGKKTERSLKTVEEITHNKNALAAQYKQVFAGQDFEVVDNFDWFSKINYLDFLRDVGKHVPMTQMLDREFVQSRIGKDGVGISYAEFSYSLIQGYDFLHLFREKGATLQVAGADQWGNSIAGVQLIRRLADGEAHVLTAPLVVNKQTGVKFGKSEGGAVWLDAEKTSPYQFYQFWLNIDDGMAEDLIKIYTLLDRDTIDSTIEEHRSAPEKRQLQRTLAQEVTKLIHGEAKLQSVERVTEVLFGGKSFADLDGEDIKVLEREIPTVEAPDVIGALSESSIVSSRGEAKRLIAAGAVTLDDDKISDNVTLTGNHLIKKGKNIFVLARGI